MVRVSNPVDGKNATLLLQSVCPWRGSQSKWLWKGVLLTALMLSLAGGVVIWKRKKMWSRRGLSTLLPTEPGSAALSQAPPTEEPAGATSHCPPDLELSLLRHAKDDMERGSCHPPSPECTPTVHTVYDKIRMNREPQEDA
ncbi:uncharacterized protein LOC105234448 isoform X3 [Ailuropoda melanoleuca]|uniref:uncharacterized protein LOC105234448 isoform X3 n=1 Tax=Ailuropoda melanoleuca TaxID=9646 RepID=UPI001494A221|nr:uncharacterized protein LOC105234448 isoform X3 [Ailuropoda melanoleuca]